MSQRDELGSASYQRLCPWMGQEASRPDSPQVDPRRERPEMRGEALCSRAVISWLLTIGGDVVESEEMAHHSLSPHELDNLEQMETAL